MSRAIFQTHAPRPVLPFTTCGMCGARVELPRPVACILLDPPCRSVYRHYHAACPAGHDLFIPLPSEGRR